MTALAITALFIGDCKKDKSDNNWMLLFLGGSNSAPPPPELYFRYQNNTKLITEYGMFFHRKKNFAGVQEITDYKAVKMSRELETEDQSTKDHNWFALDGKLGAVIYSRGTKRYDAYQNDALKGAKAFAVLPNGKIAILTSVGSVNLCHDFNGNVVQSVTNCGNASITAALITAEDDDNYLALDTSNAVKRINAATGETTNVTAWSDIVEPVSLYSDGVIAALIDKRGMRVRVANRAGDNYLHAATAEPVNGIARNKDGYYYVASRAFNMGAILKPDLQAHARITFPNLPAPGVKVQDVRGVSMAPVSGLVYVFARDSFTAFSEGLDMSTSSGEIYLPSEMQPLIDAAQTLSADDLKNSANLMEIPAIKSAAEQAIRDMKYKLE